MQLLWTEEAETKKKKTLKGMKEEDLAVREAEWVEDKRVSEGVFAP